MPLKPINASIVTILPSDQRDNILTMYFNEISKTQPLNHEETIHYIKLAQQGDEEAIDKIVKANLRFVVTVAKRYLCKDVDIKDLISEGNLGLIDAIMAYNINMSHKVKFISYAVFYIRKRIIQHIEENISVAKIPHSVMKHVTKIKQNKEYEDLEKYLTEINMENRVDLYKKIVSAMYAMRHISIYNNINEDTESCIIDIVPDEDQINYHFRVLRINDIRYILNKAIERLDENEKNVIEQLYRKNYKNYTPRTVASMIGISLEELQKIKKKALNKMRTYLQQNYYNEIRELIRDLV